jgi:hypothetical protein
MRSLRPTALLLTSLLLGAAACSGPAGSSDAGPVDRVQPPDTPVTGDGPSTVDARFREAGDDVPAADAGQDAPADASPPDLTAGDSGTDPVGQDSGPDVPVDPRPGWISHTGGGPTPRWGHAIALDSAGGRVFIFGGAGYAGRVGELWSFSLATTDWDRPTTTGGPGARNGTVAVSDPARGRILFIGGDRGSLTAEVWALALGDLSWSMLPALPSARSQVSAALVSGTPDRLYVLGGRTASTTVTAELLRLDLTDDAATWEMVTTVGTPPEARERAVLLPRGGRLYLTTGDDTSSAVPSSWVLDVATLTWSPLSAGGTPGALRESSGTLDEACGRALLVGGRDASSTDVSAVGTLGLIDPGASHGTLDTRNSLPARSYTGAVLDPTTRRLFVFGGRRGTDIFDDTYTLDLPACP